jgi:hypothetical protein
MDQRSIYVFLAIKWFSAQAIHSELVVVLDSDAITYSTVAMYLRQRKFSVIPCQLPEDTSTTIIDNTILDALDK